MSLKSGNSWRTKMSDSSILSVIEKDRTEAEAKVAGEGGGKVDSAGDRRAMTFNQLDLGQLEETADSRARPISTWAGARVCARPYVTLHLRARRFIQFTRLIRLNRDVTSPSFRFDSRADVSLTRRRPPRRRRIDLTTCVRECVHRVYRAWQTCIEACFDNRDSSHPL